MNQLINKCVDLFKGRSTYEILLSFCVIFFIAALFKGSFLFISLVSELIEVTVQQKQATIEQNILIKNTNELYISIENKNKERHNEIIDNQEKIINYVEENNQMLKDDKKQNL